MFTERFEGSRRPAGTRIELCFRPTVTKVGPLKDDWAFVWDDALRFNIAYAIQEVHFDILLVNNYNVYGAIETLKLKHALVQIASVAEGVLQYMLHLIEDDPRVQDALGEEWKWLDFTDPTQGRIEVPAGQRVVAGIQHKVQGALRRNTKMKTLIEVAARAGIIDEPMAADLHELREQRNRVHIKSLTSPEYADYTPEMANSAIETLERFRGVAFRWTYEERKRRAQAEPQFVPAVVASNTVVPDFVSADDDIPF